MFTFDNGGNRAAAAAVVRLPAHPRPLPLKGFVSIELKQVCHSQAGARRPPFFLSVAMLYKLVRISELPLLACKAVIGLLFLS